MDARALGQQIKRLRKLRKLTQEQLGERAELQPKSVSELERGAFLPSLETLDQIRNALSSTWAELLDHAEEDVKGAIRLRLIEHIMRAGVTELLDMERRLK